ncbi:MAG: helix-turn-helix transcriptional regulator [Phormidesmis sp. RL_2_1]|nr:helix-turn-helix transcriptional regulator [Phormidesmis sp. RL_2_1]
MSQIRTSAAPIRLNSREEVDQVLDNHPILSSHDLGWSGLNLDYRKFGATGFQATIVPHHYITFACQAERTPKMLRYADGREWQDTSPVGSAIIVPANFSYGQYWDIELQAITLYLSPAHLATVIDETATPDEVELLPQFSKPDPLLYQLALGLKGILETGGQGDRIYAETLTHTLMVHLLQCYSTRPASPKTYTDGLSKQKLKLVLNYIQTHLDQALGLKELANLLQLSPHYFAHLFKQSMSLAPHQYVISQRVKRAQQLLKKQDFSIAEIAYQVGFSSQAHLNRHFKRAVGITPGRYRRG